MQLRANLARSWRFQLPDNLSWCPRYSTSGQLVRKCPAFNFRPTWAEVTARFRKLGNLWPTWPQVPYLTSAQLGQKLLCRADSRINLCSIWSQVGVYRVNFWSWWPEVLSENCVQGGHNFTSDQVGPKLWYKINLWPCWSQVEIPDSKSVANLATFSMTVRFADYNQLLDKLSRSEASGTLLKNRHHF